jgi:hypothetical protein
MNWIYTNILHTPRKALGISVLEYCVLDYIYKTQTHPEYGVNGWTKTGCHKIADFLGVSSGTVKGIFDRMDSDGFLERMGNDLKRSTAKFYSIAYENDVQKLNSNRSETEHVPVQKLNSNRSETEQYINKETKVLNKIKYKEPQIENDILVTTIDQVDETAVKVVEVIPSKPKKTPKFIYPPTLDELIPLFFDKLTEKKRQHPQIVDCWNWANHQAEKFFLHWEAKGWKIERLNSAIATWVNGAIGYGQVTKPCPIQYKNNPANAQPAAQPTKLHVARLELTSEDLEYSQAAFADVVQIFKGMGV